VIGLPLAVMIGSCVENFEMPVTGDKVRFLVVDGFLNTGNGNVNVNVLRASMISESGSAFEADATVVLEDPAGNSYLLAELGSGKYQGSTPAVEAGLQYRLYIKTEDGKEYRSAFITVKSTPEIKEVSWKALTDGTQITLDTEDATHSTRYYQWVLEETWEYHSRYSSYCSLAVSPDTIIAIPRSPAEMIDVCYRTQPSTRIFTATTTGLTQDQINDYELVFLPKGTEKLGYLYSILVRQYSISKETYEYLEKLKKTSQDLGGLYSPQPSNVTGNLYNVADPSEVVLGYFNAGAATEKRLFITLDELPASLRTVKPDPTFCTTGTITANNPDTLQKKLRGFVATKKNLPLEAIFQDARLYGITHSTTECVDCRVKGGKTIKPVFWP